MRLCDLERAQGLTRDELEGARYAKLGPQPSSVCVCVGVVRVCSETSWV